jgi:serine/threonine protein kinase
MARLEEYASAKLKRISTMPSKYSKSQKSYASSKWTIYSLKSLSSHKSSTLSLYAHYQVKMSGFCQDERHLYMLLDYIVGGELFTYLRQEAKLEPLHARFYASQIVCIFEYLHNKNIIYRDLKPENLLICSNGYLKLTDFGFAKICKGRTYTLCGTPEYLSPEILLNKGHGKPVDWWTLGILIYEMIAGIDPFTDDDPMAIYQKILKGKVKFPRDFDKNAKSIVKHLLVADISKRYGCMKNGADDVKTHRWFEGLEWAKLLLFQIKAPYTPIIK